MHFFRYVVKTMSNKEKRITQSSKKALRNPWVLGWLGLLSLVLVVNMGMITTAFMTNPGLVDKDYYEKGRDHEENFLKKRMARNALGWSFRLDIPEQLTIGKTEKIRFNVVDKYGVPLRDISVNLHAYRPSDASADFFMQMKEFAPGQYQADAKFVLKGVWELHVKVTQADESYELITQRISVQSL